MAWCRWRTPRRGEDDHPNNLALRARHTRRLPANPNVGAVLLVDDAVDVVTG